MTVSAFGIGVFVEIWLAAIAVLLAALPLVERNNDAGVAGDMGAVRQSLALMWVTRHPQLRHAAYFGLGAYTYAIASFNIGREQVPVLLGCVVPAVVAAIIGAMMFYRPHQRALSGVMTLVVTLILNRFMNATAGDAYKIGNARLGGFDGIQPFQPQRVGEPNIEVYGTAHYYVVIVCLLVAYLIARSILRTASGDAQSAFAKMSCAWNSSLGTFPPTRRRSSPGWSDGGACGCLFANWAEIVTPSVCGLGQTAEVLIWSSSGVSDPIGPMIAAVALGS